MSEETAVPLADTELDESAVSRAELHIEREKIQIERERLALERERLVAERERWKSDAELISRGEGRGIAFSTLVLVGIIGVLLGVITGFFLNGPRGSQSSTVGIETLSASAISTNALGRGDNSITLRPMDAGSGKKAYLLIVN